MQWGRVPQERSDEERRSKILTFLINKLRGEAESIFIGGFRTSKPQAIIVDT